MLPERLDPRSFLTFVELDEFIDDWKSLALNEESDIWDLQTAIMANPTRAPVVAGTGGLRKLRFSAAKQKIGKSQAVRVCYVYFPEHALALLCAAYDHREKDNLSSEEKRGIRRYIEEIGKWLHERPRRSKPGR